jgi:hypothetical protein
MSDPLQRPEPPETPETPQPPDSPVSSEWDQTGADLAGGDWDQAPAPGAGRAAGLLWVCALVQIVFFGCFVLAVLQLPLEQWRDLMTKGGATLPTEDPVILRSAVVMVAVLVAIVGIVPGIVYAVCGWGVRAGKRPAATQGCLILPS